MQTEYELVELALQRVQRVHAAQSVHVEGAHVEGVQVQDAETLPTDGQYIMAVITPLLIFFSSIIILFYANIANHTEHEKTSPILSVCFSAIMLIIECVSICYKHHPRYAMIPSIMELLVRVQIFHLIICGSFVPYVNTSKDYGTYETWIHVVTMPLIILSIFPCLMGVYRIE
jgi:hypothetical protein